MKIDKLITLEEQDIMQAVRMFLGSKGIHPDTVCNYAFVPRGDGRPEKITVQLEQETIP